MHTCKNVSLYAIIYRTNISQLLFVTLLSVLYNSNTNNVPVTAYKMCDKTTQNCY